MEGTKTETGTASDAFLSHNTIDKPIVKKIGRWLEGEAGLRVWLDEWNLVPGDPVQEALEDALEGTQCLVVFFGAEGIGPWQNEEMRAALDRRISRAGVRVVPVLLPGAEKPSKESQLPPFVRRLLWVRFEHDWNEEAALHRLLCGIQGIPPKRFEGSAPSEPARSDKAQPETAQSETPEASESDARCPYRGLEVFRPEDRQFFFGREAQTELLLDHLRENRFLVVIGPSGSGKSSVVQAGVLPRLEDSLLGGGRLGDGLLSGGTASFQIFTPAARPLEELAFALHRGFPPGQAPATEDLERRLEASDQALHRITRELVHAARIECFVLVIDQFEELFTLAEGKQESERFVSNLLGAVERPGPASVILTMRSDFLGHCASDPDLNVFVLEHLFQLSPMSPDELRSAIVEPARLAGLELEDGLVDEMLADVERSPSELPLLEHALLELYDRRDGARLTRATYQQIGRITGALARRAEEQFQKLNEAEQATLRKMFVLCLVKVGEGTEDTRRRALREELLAVGQDRPSAESLLDQWTAARLLVTTTDEERQLQQVELAHEALIRRWPRLRQWIDEDRETARQVEGLRRAAKEWQEQGCTADYLFTGTRLAQARELLDSHGKDLSDLEKGFVLAALRRARKFLLGMVAILALALGIATYLVSELARSKFEAEENRNAALRQLSLNYWKQGQEERRTQRLLSSLHWVTEAMAISPGDSLRQSQALSLPPVLPQSALRQSFPLGESVVGALFNDDGSRVLTWSEDNTARLWDPASGRQIGPSLQHQGTVFGALFSGDGSRVLTWSEDNTARLWDSTSGQQIGPSLEHEDDVRGASFNSDESRVLTWSADQTARLWDPASGRQIGPSLQHKGTVRGALFNEDANCVLTWSTDQTARLWDSTSGLQIGPSFEHEGDVWGASFNSNGSRVLTWSEDRTARLWDTESGLQIGPSFQHEGRVWGASFNGDASRVLTWSDDRTARLWDTESGLQTGPNLEHEGWILGASFDEDANRVLTWSTDRARLWDTKSGLQIGPNFEHEGDVWGALFNGDGSHVLTWSDDRTARLWDTESGLQVGPSLEHEGRVWGALFNGDESRVLTWSSDQMARVWDRASGQQAGPSLENGWGFLGMLFNGDASHVLTWGNDGIAQRWDAESGLQIGPGLEHEGWVLGASFNDDESRVLTWSDDGTARLWHAESGLQIGPSLEHEGWVLGALFDSDESRILTWSSDDTARLWDAESGLQIGPSLEHGAVSGALFNNGESQVLTWGGDQTARLWDAENGLQIGPSLEHEGDVMGALFSHDGSRVLTWSRSGTAQLWDAGSGQRTGPSLEHGGAVWGALFKAHGSRVLTWSRDGTARLWDAESGLQIGPSLEHEGAVSGALFNSDESRVLTWSEDNTARVWDAESGLQIGPSLEHERIVLGALFNCDEDRVLTWGDDNTARLWDAESGQQIGPSLEHEGTVLGALFNEDESRVLTWNTTRAQFWDVGVDLDFPADSLRLQVRALTGTTLDPQSSKVSGIPSERWREDRQAWERVGRAHYLECEHPRHNLWRRFNLEEAERIRPLDGSEP